MHLSIEGGQNHYNMEKREGILNRHADHSSDKQSFSGSKNSKMEIENSDLDLFKQISSSKEKKIGKFKRVGS